jgi:hypothetical protein
MLRFEMKEEEGPGVGGELHRKPRFGGNRMDWPDVDHLSDPVQQK